MASGTEHFTPSWGHHCQKDSDEKSWQLWDKLDQGVFLIFPPAQETWNAVI